MLKVLSCLAIEHDLSLVALAVLVCLFACYTTVELLNRARVSRGGAATAWMFTAGTVAGSGIWATHFVAMLAYKSALPISYDIGMTALSVLAAIVLASLGFAVGLLTQLRMLGGAVLGGAVATMHFLGMEALSGPVVVSWDAAYVSAAIGMGVGFSALSMRVALNARTASGTMAAAVMLALTICVLHFTAMTAVTLTPIAGEGDLADAVAPTSLAVAVAAVAMLVIGLGATATMMRHHREERAQSEALRTHVAALQAAKIDLEATSRHLEAALDAAARSSEAKSQFLASMSHELRTPLNAIIGYSEFLGMQPYGAMPDARYLEYIGDIQTSGGHLLALINDVLDLARLDAGRVELEEDSVDLAELVEDSLTLVAPQARKGRVTLEASIPKEPAIVRGDARRLKQVLVNLLSNGVKFTPGGGSVCVSLKCGAEGICLVVADTGIGMRPEDIPVAFDKFGQVESSLARRYQGTGLGLPLARDLVVLHGGDLVIDSVYGEGTSVTVTLPASRRLAAYSQSRAA
jgi:signal transduction histidine kinase